MGQFVFKIVVQASVGGRRGEGGAHAESTLSKRFPDPTAPRRPPVLVTPMRCRLAVRLFSRSLLICKGRARVNDSEHGQHVPGCGIVRWMMCGHRAPRVLTPPASASSCPPPLASPPLHLPCPASPPHWQTPCPCCASGPRGMWSCRLRGGMRQAGRSVALPAGQQTGGGDQPHATNPANQPAPCKGRHRGCSWQSGSHPPGAAATSTTCSPS